MYNKPRMRGWAAAGFAAIVSLVLASAAFGDPSPSAPSGPRVPLAVASLHPLAPTIPAEQAPISRIPIERPVTRPPGGTTAVRRPIAGGFCGRIDIKTLKPGTRVALSCLPALPMKRGVNTASPKVSSRGKHYRPLAATGATIDLTSGANCGSSGALYSIGCSLTWQATNNGDWSTSDSYQDYEIPPNATSATLISGTYAYNAATAHVTTLSQAGTYAFFVYDTTAKVIVSIVYVNAGQSFQIGVYQDPYHTQSSYQFNVNTSAAAYIYLPDVSTNDSYVVYVMSTSVNSYCVYVTPNSTPAPPAPSPAPTGAANSLICNPANSPGISAPSGQLSLEWQLNNGYPAGTYSVVVYDKTAGETVGQVQVSLTGFQQYGFLLYASPGPNQTPVAPATPTTTVFDWDSANDQSDGGIYATVPNQVGGTYRLTASDPDGQVVNVQTLAAIPGTCTLTNNSSAACTATGTFSFAGASPALNSPGNYPNNTWTMQLYNPATQTVEASQAFQLLGYSMETQFNVGGVLQSTIVFGCCTNGTVYNQAATMVFTNNGNFNFPNAADSLRGIEYTTGPGSTLGTSFSPPSGTTGNGVTFTMVGCTGAYNSGTGCYETVTDSSGNSWTACRPLQHEQSGCSRHEKPVRARFYARNQRHASPRPIHNDAVIDVLCRRRHAGLALLCRAVRDDDVDLSVTWLELVEYQRDVAGVVAGVLRQQRCDDSWHCRRAVCRFSHLPRQHVTKRRRRVDEPAELAVDQHALLSQRIRARRVSRQHAVRGFFGPRGHPRDQSVGLHRRGRPGALMRGCERRRFGRSARDVPDVHRRDADHGGSRRAYPS